jgi:hypothetical protein
VTKANKPIVFLGPTLKHSVAAQLCDYELRAPAGMGDITLALANRPEAIILIDGVFEDQPSVWHKEILLALSKDIPIIGASSMGALRAAELSAFGMTGFGTIYNSFADGTLNDDDEVAVVHGPPELNWQTLSDAMVDIRDFIATAVRCGILEAGEAENVVAHAKAQHFKFRTLEGSLELVLQNSRSKSEKAKICAWFLNRGLGLKERDCRALLSQSSELIEKAKSNFSFRAEFIPTIYMNRLDKFGFRNLQTSRN